MPETPADRGHRLRQLRVIAGADQLELAKALGFQTQSGLSLLENGKRKITATHVEAAADYIAPIIGEPREEVIGFLHGLRRFTFSPTAEAFPVVEGEGRDSKRRKRPSAASRTAISYFTQTSPDLGQQVA